MSKWDKLLKRLKSLPNDMRFAEVEKILKGLGYSEDASHGGSHVIFRRRGKGPISVPKHDPIKRAYIVIIKNAVTEDDDEQS